MNTLKRLEKLLLRGHITVEEYKNKRSVFEEKLFELYCLDLITEEELKERLDK